MGRGPACYHGDAGGPRAAAEHSIGGEPLEKYELTAAHVNAELEAAVLAQLQGTPGLYWQTLDHLLPEYFTGPRAADYGRLAQAAEAGAATQGPAVLPPDLLGQVKALGELYQKRQLAAVLSEAAQGLPGERAGDVLGRLADAVGNLQNATREAQAGRLVQVPGLFDELLLDISKRRDAVRLHGRAVPGIPTGIPKLDRLLGGLQTGLHLLAAEPAVGKTTYALQLGVRTAADGTPALFVSYEESLPRLALKALCSAAGLEAKKYADGWGDTEDLQRAAGEHGASLSRLYLLEGTVKLTVAHVKAKALQIMAAHGADRCLIALDYIQKAAALRRDAPDYRLAVNGLVAELRELALRLDSPVLVIAAMNRQSMTEANGTRQRAPGMNALRESSDLEYSADSLTFLWEANPDNRGELVREVRATLRKNRFGDTGDAHLIFRPALGRFAEKA